MRRSIRYALASLAAGAIVASLAGLTDSSPFLLAGIGVSYAVGIAIVLRPDVRRLASASESTASAVFSAVTAFGVLAIAQGISEEFQAGAAVLALGLAYFGYVSGVWLIVETVDADEPDRDRSSSEGIA